MAIIASGNWINPPGAPFVFVGGTDFSELTPFVGATSWPAEFLRDLGGGGNQSIEDNLDGEGVIVRQNDTNAGNLIINRFEDIFQFGEILVRFYLDAGNSGIRMKHGQGAFREADSIATFGLVSTFNGVASGRGAITPPAQATDVTAGVNLPGGLVQYMWMRIRFDDAGGGFTRIRIHFTDSPFNQPPSVPTVWDIDEVSSAAAFQPGPWGTRLGWIRTTIGPTQVSDRRVSFLSFSTDPDNFAPPTPSAGGTVPGADQIVDATAAIVPPAVVVDPLQDTWVGLIGDPFIQATTPLYPAATPPSFITDAIGAWEFTNYREDPYTKAGLQTRVMRDLSRNGQYLCMGDEGQRDSAIDWGPFGIPKLGVHCGGIAFRIIEYLNTDQRLNVGGSGGVVRFTVNFTMDLAGGADQTIVNHGISTDRGWYIIVNNGGVPRYNWSEDGAANVAAQSTVNLNTVFADWDDMWLRVTHDFDADTVVFETSVDGSTWVQLGATVNTTAAAGLHQVDASSNLEFGGFWLGQNALSQGGCVFRVQAEQDAAVAWNIDVGSAAVAEFTPGQNQNNASSDSGIRENHMRMSSGGSSEFQTFFDATVRAFSNEFDVAVGDVLAVVMVAAMDQIEAGAGSFRIPLSHKNSGAVGEQGWGVENDGAVNGYDFRGSDGVTQQATPVVQLANDHDLFASVYEIDGPGGEIRQGVVGQALSVGTWNNQGTGSPTQPLIIGRTGVGFDMTQDFLGCAVFKRALTLTEKSELATFLSNGRL